jgi:hypothetical protein
MKIKKIKYLFSLSLVLVFFLNCSEDVNNLSFIDDVVAPTNLKAVFNIVPDNSGLVSITPNADGAVSYEIGFGDGSEDIAVVETGESITHVYEEGNYTVSIKAIGITGLESEATQQLVVSFRAPENLVINADIDASNPFQVNVSASADYAASFLVYFDSSNPDEEPTQMALEETVSFVYPLVGDYTVRVVAQSGGVETTEGTADVTVSTPTELPIDFEVFDTTVFFGFGGASGEVIDNPDTNGNPSAKVAKIVKGAPEVWAGNVIVTSAPIDFSTKKLITLDVWSPRPGGTLTFKLENLNDAGIFIEKQVPLVGNSQWEEVSIDFSDIDESQSYQKLVWFFDLGTAGDGSDDWTFYVDNIDQDFAGVVTSQMIEDFEGTPPAFTVFGDIAATEVIANPDASGINTSANVAQLTKSNGSQVWAGTFFETAAPIDLAAFGQINVKTWSPTAGIVVKLKLENADASVTHEVDLNTTVANAWENLLYDFSAAPVADYVRIVIFFDFGTAGDGSAYYFDDIELIGSSGIPPLEFENFEGAAPAFTVFGDIAATEVIANPDASGINTTGNVAQLTKTNGSQVWAGTFFEVGTPLDFASYTKVSVKTWAPKTGIVVKLKLENADASVTHEVDINNTLLNQWEELVYDFSGAPAADYVRVVIFFDFGTAGDDSVYYFDEFTLTN